MASKSDCRIWQFDYLKFFAMILVILQHSDFSNNQRDFFMFPYLVDMAVPIFMIITGYMSSLSIEKRKISSSKEYFTSGLAFKKIKAIIIPFILVYILEVIIYALFSNANINMKFFKYLIRNDHMGPGSYYPYVLFQIFLLFPIIYFPYVKNPILTSILVIAAQFGLEYYKLVINIPSEIFRILCIRYIICILLGIILYHNRERLKSKKSYLLAIPSIIYIYIVSYAEYENQLFTRWISTSVPTNLWAFTLVLLGINCFKKLPDILHKLFTKISKGTYFIFLTQMVWFKSKLDEQVPLSISIFLNILICFSVGLVFQAFYNKFISIFKTKHKKKSN